MDIERIRELGQALREQVGRAVIGQEEAVDLLFVTLVTGSHLLLEGPPGTGKTLLARCFAASLQLEFKRIQFTPDLAALGLRPLCDLAFLLGVRDVVSSLRLADEMADYVVDLVRATREHPALRWGASPRSANMLASAARAAAVLDGRDFVIPDDVKRLWKPLMRHRIILSPSAEVDGLGTETILDQVLTRVPAPR